MSNTNSIHPTLYVETGSSFNPQRMDDDVYKQVVSNTVIVCVDTVLISTEQRLFYLAKRKAKPMQNWWFIGGRVLPGETGPEAACRCIERETHLVVYQKKLVPVAMNRYFFNSRQQEPQSLGCDSLCYVFSLEATSWMISEASKNLDCDEYGPVGLGGFNHEALVDQKVNQAVIDLYELIFPAT